MSRGLQALFDGARCRDMVSNRPFSPRRPAPGRAGLAHQVAGDTSVAQLTNQNFIIGAGLTIFVLIEHGTLLTDGYRYLTGRGNYGSSTDTNFGFNVGGFLEMSSGLESSGSIGGMPAAGLHSYAVTNLGTAMAGYIDGTVSGSASHESPITAGAQTMQIGASSDDYLTEFVSGQYLLVGWWNRALAPGEIRALHANPWQLFAPEQTPFFTPVVTAQYARPSSDVSAGTWTASAGSDLYAMLDETAASDADYISTTGASTCEVALGSLTDPASSAGHVVRYRISATSGGITVRLRQGTTTIATWTHDPAPGSLTTYEQTLSGAEADSITDYTAMRLQFEATT